ncbi:tetratricopeptide repeat protein 7B isoform X3 [Corythoichthys intestinalis]|uniref:tetratricopeptide repeat protein 7B isoform X3 n=1 Tax=Corythoichthys intestinalis TaxID=161448 RepID=UPI0025A6843F|nr:tetratricopeptide repeat protein 7B isoform X3 [Corythoichthys intestinalis]XP_061798541.1 tetratricopeptide repeat protein 7B-like isoform X1 [Nerophis lumbriciformis]
MTAKKSGSRLETEIERCRSEAQWDKIPELVRQLSAKLISNDDLGELLLGECKLLTYLKENPIKQGASPRGPRPKLVEVRKHLTAALDRGNLKADYLQEASLLMAKLSYVEAEYTDALGHYNRVNLDDMQLAGAPVYRLSMIAEAYATKGLCLEKVPAPSPLLSNKKGSSPSTDRNTSEREQEIITCYEKSGDIALLYLQEAEKALSAGIQNRSPKPGPASQDQELGYFLETGLQRAHVIHFKNGNLTQGVGRFREILRAVETRTTQNLRMTIARQLAEILLRGMCEQSYWSPVEDPPTVSPLDDPSRQGHVQSKKYSLSRRPRVYSGENIFCPQENTEEALLLLLISESMANRDAVLSRIPEHNNDRIISLQSASVVYDLLTIALGRRGQYEMLSECLERAMKFAFEEFHLWYQLALSLMAAGKSARAVKVLKECIRLKPDDPTIPLLAVKLCIGPLHWLDEGECFAKMVIDMGENAAEFRAKGYLAIGLVYSLKATDASLRSTQEEYQRKALGAFQRAQSLSPTDHLAAFYLALQLAVSRQIPEALGYVRQALQLQGDDVHSLHLLALLLSAQKHYQDGLNIIEMALSEYPENFNLLYTKVKLESMCRGSEEALLTCKHMLQIWKSFYNLTNPSDSGRGSSLLDRAVADRRQLNAMTLPDFSDPDTASGSSSSHTGSEPVSPTSPSSVSTLSSPLSCPSSPVFILQPPPKKSSFLPPPPLMNTKAATHSFSNHVTLRRLSSNCGPQDANTLGFSSMFSVCSVHATSIAASRVEQALSEVASSLQSSAPKHGPLHPWMTLAQIWLHAAEVYIGMSKPAEASACTQEASNLFPTSHNVLFMRGQIAELRGNIDEAKRWYEEALSINPTHVKTMQRLGLILYQLQRYSLSEKVLRDAVQVNSTAHDVWNSLGEVLQAQGNAAAATECFLTALELEASSPILPFTIIPRAL